LAFGEIPRLLCDDETGDIVHVAVFGSEVNLVGTLPAAAIAGLSALTYLEIFGSRGIGGTVPAAAIGSLRSLQYLDLMGNALTGTIGPELARATNLVEIYLASNRLFGTVPQALAALPFDYVWMFENRLVGPFPVFSVATNCTAMGSDDLRLRPDFNCFSTCSAECCAKNSTRCAYTGALEPTQIYRPPTTAAPATPPPTTRYVGQPLPPTSYVPPPTVPPVTARRTPPVLAQTTKAAGATTAGKQKTDAAMTVDHDALLGLWIFLGVCVVLTVLGLLIFCYIRRSTERDYPRDRKPRPSVNSVVFPPDERSPQPFYDDMSINRKPVPPIPFYDQVASPHNVASLPMHESGELRIDHQQRAESMELRLKGTLSPSQYQDVPPSQINVANDFYGRDRALNDL